MSPKKATKRTTKKGSFSAEEIAAMKERARELKSSGDRQDGEKDLLSKIAAMTPADQALAKRLHQLITAAAPELWPKTWYGFPAYAKNDKIVCFFQPASKFKTRYSTLGFSDTAKLDDGNMWPTSYALIKLTATEEAKITALVKKAAK